LLKARVIDLHFHFFCWNFPAVLLPIDCGPFHVSNFARTLEE
jgi:hypothetical protein